MSNTESKTLKTVLQTLALGCPPFQLLWLHFVWTLSTTAHFTRIEVLAIKGGQTHLLKVMHYLETGTAAFQEN